MTSRRCVPIALHSCAPLWILGWAKAGSIVALSEPGVRIRRTLCPCPLVVQTLFMRRSQRTGTRKTPDFSRPGMGVLPHWGSYWRPAATICSLSLNEKSPASSAQGRCVRRRSRDSGRRTTSLRALLRSRSKRADAMVARDSAHPAGTGRSPLSSRLSATWPANCHSIPPPCASRSRRSNPPAQSSWTRRLRRFVSAPSRNFRKSSGV